MSSQFEKNFPSLTRDNSISIMKAEYCSLIGLAWGNYWDKNTIKKNCLDKVKVREAIENERELCQKAYDKLKDTDNPYLINQFLGRIKTCDRLLQSLGLDGEQK